jgi:hypothetical protein
VQLAEHVVGFVLDLSPEIVAVRVWRRESGVTLAEIIEVGVRPALDDLEDDVQFGLGDVGENRERMPYR